MKEAIFNGIYYRKNDFRGGRPSLVFVHGVSGSSSAWAKYEEYFEEKYNLLSYDLRGHGFSSKSQNYEEYGIKQSVADLYELVNHLGLKDFVLVSHSMGTFIALEFILEHQDLTSGAVFLSPNFNVRHGWLLFFLHPALWFANALDAIFGMPKARGRLDYSRYLNTGDWNLRRLFADVRNTGLSVYLYSVKQYSVFEREEYLDSIKIPTLIVHGIKDSIFPVKASRSIAGKIKGSELVILNDADHILVLNHFPRVSAAIEKFVNEAHSRNI
jgi:pimeloyl-ACP methyl ester carboxylesterase